MPKDMNNKSRKKGMPKPGGKKDMRLKPNNNKKKKKTK